MTTPIHHYVPAADKPQHRLARSPTNRPPLYQLHPGIGRFSRQQPHQHP